MAMLLPLPPSPVQNGEADADGAGGDCCGKRVGDGADCGVICSGGDAGGGTFRCCSLFPPAQAGHGREKNNVKAQKQVKKEMFLLVILEK